MSTRPFEQLTEADLRRRTSLKWQLHGPEVLPVWVAEMDVVPAPEVVEALVRAARTGDTGYPGTRTGYAEALAQFAERRWGWSPNPADSIMCADVMTGIRALVERLVPVGGAVVIPTPVYPPFSMFTDEAGRRVEQVPLTAQDRLDLPAIEAAITATSARMLLLCSPQNPTGTVHTRTELEAVAGIAERTGATVVVDEVHGPLVPVGSTFTPWLAVSDSGFIVTSAAKAFNLAGLKAGLILAGPGSRAALRSLPASLMYGASHLGVIGHSAAYLAEDAWLDAVNANIADNRALLADLITEHLPHVGYRVPASTYLTWLDMRALGLGEDPAAPLLTQAQVALTSGPPFGLGSTGFARMNIACSESVLTEAVRRIASAAG